MSSRKQPSSRGWIGGLAAAAISLAALFSVISYSGFIADQISYYRYQPDQTIASFAERSGMSSHGTFLFYASQPSLESAERFNDECGRAEAKTAILGCYAQRKIHIYDVSDERLVGIRTTTAAHEMLHAAYERLGAKEKENIDRLLEAQFDTLKSDQSLVDRMAFYERTEPGERYNELHSVIATEIASISPELETYYERYFDDRSKVVALHARYESVFTSLQARADELNRQISDLGAAIKADTEAYNKEADSLKNDIGRFNDRANRGEFDSQAEFNAERRVLVARSNDLEALRMKINASIQSYNALVTELNGIATQTNDLNRSIDSTLESPPSL